MTESEALRAFVVHGAAIVALGILLQAFLLWWLFGSMARDTARACTVMARAISKACVASTAQQETPLTTGR